MTTRRKIVAALALAVATAVAGCLDALAPGAPHRTASLGIVPVFEGTAGQGIPSDVDSIVVTIHNPNPPPPDTTLGIRVEPGQDSIVLTISVPLSGAESDVRTVTFHAIRSSDGDTLYTGQQDIPLRVGQPTHADSVRVRYVGPGQNIEYIGIRPTSVALKPGDSTSFDFTARDSTGATIIGMPVLWRSLAPSIATISASGIARGVAIGQTWVFVISGARSSVYDSALVVVSTSPVGIIGLAPATASFAATAGGASPAAQSVAVTNTGLGTLGGLTVSGIAYGASEPTGWLTATLGASTAPTTLALQPATGSLGQGTYHATVSVASALASNSPQTVAVTFAVAANPTIALSSAAVTFLDTVTTSDPAAQTVSVTNTGGGALTGLAVGTITYGSGSGWLTASLDQATAPATLTLSVAKGALAPGTYTATVPITSPVAGNSPQTVAVTFTIAPLPLIGLSATTATFLDTMTTSDPAAQTVAVTNVGTGTLSGLAVGTISYGSGSGWLTASLDQATAPATLTLSVAKGALGPGTYTATVPVTSAQAGNSPQTVAVTFTIAPLPLIGLAPAAVTFDDTVLTSDPASQAVAVTNAGTGTLNGLAVGTITYGSGSGWLTASLDQASAPATLTLTVAKGALAAGTYTATVPITSGVAGNSPQTVAVTFTIAPNPLARIAFTTGYELVLSTNTASFAVEGFDASGATVSTPGLRFLSRSPGVVTVDSLTGTATPVGPGSAVIVASAPGTTGTVYDSTFVAVETSGSAIAFPIANGRGYGLANVGDTVHVLVRVDIGTVPGEALGSYNAQLNWNPSALRYVRTTALAFASNTVVNETLTATGQLQFGAADPNGVSSYYVDLVDVTFVANAAGGTPLTLGLTDLSGIAPNFTQMLTQALVISTGVQVK